MVQIREGLGSKPDKATSIFKIVTALLLGLDRAHPQKTNKQYHQACTEMEPTAKEKSRLPQEQLEENGRRLSGQDRLHLEGA